MLLKLFLAFTLFPFLEIFLLMEIGSRIGIVNTLLLLILTGFLGAWLARLQGLQAMSRVQSSLSKGIMPREDLMDALLIFIAGVVLLTPGFITDMAGLLILFPRTRVPIKQFTQQKFDQWIQKRSIHFDL